MRKLNEIIGKKKVRSWYLLIFLFFISGIFEVFSISLILPLLEVPSDSNF